MDIQKYKKADHLIELKKYDQAIEILEEMLPTSYSADVIWAQIGYCLEKQGEVEKAKKAFANALEENPENPHAILNLGYIALKERRYKYARKQFNKCLELNPEDHLALLNLSAVEINLYNFDAGRKYLDKAAAIAPNNEHIIKAKIELLFRENKLEGLDKKLDDSLEKIPTHAGAIAIKALLACNDKDYEKATALAQQSLLIDPFNQRAKMALAIVERNKNSLLKFFVGNAFKTYQIKWTFWRVVLMIVFIKGVLLWSGFFILYLLVTWIGFVLYNSIRRFNTRYKALLLPKEIRQSNFFLFDLGLIFILGLVTHFNPTPGLYKALCLAGLFLFIGISYYQLVSPRKIGYFLLSTIIIMFFLLFYGSAEPIDFMIQCLLALTLHGVLFSFGLIGE